MKQYIPYFFSLLIVLTFNACEEEQTNPDEFLQLDEPTYVHSIPGCDNTNNPEMNCDEWVEFLVGGEVNILVGGGDIIQRMSFKEEDDKVTVYNQAGLSSLHLVFTVINLDSLQRDDDSSYWVRKISP
ncbi:hypothetical protein [Roseivirga misakiensis]|uniref:Lipocalin-like domain-containing protein n=1 Tax=Roseivirga misakiensis TaxID=1563681 RepID=A0A1E5SZA6_9BACT|nr:hypothetical protein [Roseivirga misakiensis]OEK04452.1 hypothetical protein BFP71_13335 [Roseivirga misakiensis]